VHPQSFPHPVPEEETGIEHGYQRALARVELAVDVNEDVPVAWIVRVAVGAVCHLHVLA
jgi:hypothetical protein